MIKKQKIFYSILVVGIIFIVGTIFLTTNKYVFASLPKMADFEWYSGPCSYDHFKGKCKIISISDEYEKNVNFRFKTTIFSKFFQWTKNEEIKKIENQKHRKAALDLKLKCLDSLDKYSVTKEDLEKCNVRENAVFNCEISLITEGTCIPTNFKFFDSKKTILQNFFKSWFKPKIWKMNINRWLDEKVKEFF